jgi:signal transduction histidine kinase
MNAVFKAIKDIFSVELAIKVSALISIGIVVSGIIFYLVSAQTEFRHDYGEIIASASNYKLLVLKESLIIFFVFGILITGGIAVLSLFYSHKVAGPLYRVKRTTRDIANGRLDITVKFRKGDSIHPLSDSLNNLTNNYRERLSRLESALKELRAESADFEVSLRKQDREKAKQSTERLLSLIKEAEDALKGLKL